MTSKAAKQRHNRRMLHNRTTYYEYESDSSQDYHNFDSDEATCFGEPNPPVVDEVPCNDLRPAPHSPPDETFHYTASRDKEGDSLQEYQTIGSDEATCDGEPVLPLKEAIRNGDLSAVQRALHNETLDPNARDDDYTVLHWATRHTDMETLREEGLETNNVDERKRIVLELLEQGANVNTVWFQADVGHGSPMTPMDMTLDKEVIQILQRVSTHQALGVNDPGFPGDRDLHLRIGLISAAALGRTRECGLLCRLGANVNEDTLGTTALGIATAFGHLETVVALVQNLGADVNAVMDDNDGSQTALYCAVYEGHEAIVEFLLQYNANPLLRSSVYGGMSKWACAGMIDDNRGVDMNIRNRIIELVLSASIDKVKEPFMLSTETYWYNEIDWSDYSWVFLECVRHGYVSGMDILLTAKPNFVFPVNCIDLAVAVGENSVLEYLLQAGALDSYRGDCKEECYHGPEFARPSQASVQQCRETLSLRLRRKDMFKR